MKIYVFVLLIVAAVAFALPYNEDEDLEPVPFTDDLELAFTACSIKSMKHSACAAQCILKGRIRGSCKKGVCHCRKEKLKWQG